MGSVLMAMFLCIKRKVFMELKRMGESMNGYKKEDVLVVVFLIAFLISVAFMCTSRNDVYDNRNGADKVRDELTNAQAAQQEETSVIDETKQSIDRSQKGIDDSEQANREIASVERADAEIIAESQQILARVRERKQ